MIFPVFWCLRNYSFSQSVSLCSPNSLFIHHLVFGFFLQLLITSIADPSWFKVAKFWNGNELTAALVTEAATTIPTVLNLALGLGRIKLSLTLTAIVSQMIWDPDRRSLRLVSGCRRDQNARALPITTDLCSGTLHSCKLIHACIWIGGLPMRVVL